MIPRFLSTAGLTLLLGAAAAFGLLEPSHAQTAPLDALVAAYPDHLVRHDGKMLYWRDGTAMPASDGVEHKSYEQLLKNASILDQFHDPYPRGPLNAPPKTDPGRFRNEAFFAKMYGDCRRGGVRPHMAPIVWLPHSWGKRVYVTSVNGVAQRLTAVSAEIEKLPAKIRQAAYPISGVYACRAVQDTGKPSVHSYAAAIDLNTRFSDYWLWQKKGETIAYRNRMPYEIVEIFERHGFIWGGKWRHYDTMHFEYRPELLGMSGK